MAVEVRRSATVPLVAVWVAISTDSLPGSSGHRLALASPVRQTRAGSQYQLAASCVANPFVSHVKGGACSKNCLRPSSCSTSPSLRPFNALRDDSNATKPKIPSAERFNFSPHESSGPDSSADLMMASNSLLTANVSGRFPQENELTLINSA